MGKWVILTKDTMAWAVLCKVTKDSKRSKEASISHEVVLVAVEARE